jgi:hypothetical protein
MNLARIRGHLLRVELDGFSPLDIPLRPIAAEDASFPTLLFDPFLVIDLPTGALFTLDCPKSAKDPKPELTQFAELSVLATLHPTRNLKKIGQMQRKKPNE